MQVRILSCVPVLYPRSSIGGAADYESEGMEVRPLSRIPAYGPVAQRNSARSFYLRRCGFDSYQDYQYDSLAQQERAAVS